MGRNLRYLSVVLCLGILVFGVGCKKKKEAAEPEVPVAAVTGDLHVSFCSPKEQTQEPREADTVVVIFDRPMIPLQMLGEKSNAELIRFAPSVSGTYRWLNPKTLTFTPAKRFPYATEIQALIPAGTRSFEGLALKEDFQWTFQTVRPQLTQHFPQNKQQWLGLDAEVLLLFNIPMNPKKAQDFISFNEIDDKNREAVLEFDVKPPSKKELEENEIDASPATALILKPRQKLKPDSRYFVQVKSGLPADEGELGLDEARIIEFSTFHKFAFVEFTAGKPHDPMAELQFQFSNPVSYKELVKNIRLVPEVAIPEYYSDWDQFDDRMWISLPLQPETDYKLRIGPDLLDRFGNSLGKEAALELRTAAYPSRIDMTTGMGIVESHSDLRYPVYAINSKSVLVKAGRIKKHDVIPILNTKQIFWQKTPYVREGFYQREETLALNRKRNVREIFPVALEDLLENRTGVVFLQLDTQAEDEWSRYPKALLQVTNLGISAKYSPENNVIWVATLKEGIPVSGADVEIRGNDNKVKWRGKTDASGKAVSPGWKPLKIQSQSKWDKPRQWFFVQKEGDFAFVSSEWGTGVYPYRLGIAYDWDPKPETFRGYLFTERGIYRAGEKIHIKGVFREKSGGRWQVPTAEEVLCEIHDPFNKLLLEEKLTLDEFGSFALDFETAEEASLGSYQIVSSIGPSKEKENLEKASGSFRVEAFRPAEFEVHLRSLEESYVFGDDYRAELRATYLFGGAMGLQNVNWSLRLNPTFYSPPGYKGYFFGNQADYWDQTEGQESRLILSGEGKLDKDGAHKLETRLMPEKETDPVLATLEATVQGPSRRSVSDRIQTLVHRGEYYIGLKPESRFLTKGEKFGVNVLTANPSGEVIPGRNVKLTLLKREWHSVQKAEMGGRFRWITEKEDAEIESRSIKSKAESVLETFLPEKSGYYILKAESQDKRKNAVSTSFSFYVTGRDYVPWKREDDDVIDLVADRENYRPGEVARVLVKSPYERAQALVTLEREGVLESRVQEIVGSSSAIEIPILSEHIPNVYVCVLLVQGRTSAEKADRDQDLGKPSFKVGYVNLSVDPGEKRLSVSIEKDKETYRPKDKVSVKFKVTDREEKGTVSCLSVAVVDIGVLNLIGYRTPDPFSHFYSQRPLSVETSETRHMVVGQRVFGEKGDEPGGGLAEMAKVAAPLSLSEVELRGDFKFTAYWNPAVLTDEAGNAEVEFTLPDNLTTFRVMAVAQTKDSEFGRSEEQFRVKKPLLMQPALPRFVRIGDTFQGGVVLHNHTAQAGDVVLDCKADGLMLEDKVAVRQFSLSAGEGKEVLLAFKAEKKGTASFAFRAKMGEESDGVEISIPILMPRQTETVALYKDTLDSAGESIAVPESVFPELSELSFRASATALSGLKGSLDFLEDYPYLCLEQRLSAVLPFLVAGDIILDLKLTEASEKEIREFVLKNLKEITSYQKENGGFSLWPESSYVTPFNTCYTAFALYRAQQSGYEVDSQVVSQLLNYLRNLIRGKVKRDSYPYGARTWKTIEAYALYCLAIFDREEPAFAEKLFTEREQLPLYGKALLLKALYHGKGAADAQATLLRDLVNKLKVSSTTAHFEDDGQQEGRWIYGSSLRSTACILQTLLEVDADNPLIPAIARWIVERRNAGKWLTTQENFYSFYALNDFYRKYEDIRPDFKVKVRLAEKVLLEEAFEQRNQSVRTVKIGLAEYEPGEILELNVEKTGRGRLYYETRMTYAPRVPLSARDEGFTVYKTITDLEGKSKETIRPGELVVITLQVITPQERLFTVVNDPLPAGLEAVNPNFMTESREDQRQLEDLEDTRRPWWAGFNHIEMHDDRVLLFADWLSAGIHTHRYLARALTFGTFLMPGTRIEEMYAPEVFGRSGEAVVEILKEQ